MKKIVSLFLALLLLCSAGSALAVEYNAPGEFPICKEKVTLTVAIADHAKIEDYETNWMTQYIEEKANVDLVFQIYPNTEYNTKINVMVQSGDKLPDIIIGSFTSALVYSWAQEGALAPITEYCKDPSISYYLHDAIERTGANILGQMTMPDGEIYALPKLNQSYANEYIGKLQIYQPWLDTLGLERPTTTEEFYEVLKAFATKDPNGNGIADEVPFVGYGGVTSRWFQTLMSAFVYSSSKVKFLYAQDGVLNYAYTTDAWKEGLKYLQKLFAEGLIGVQSLTQDSDQYDTMLYTDAVTVGCYADSIRAIKKDQDERQYYYWALEPLIGPEGVQYAVFEPSACTATFVISADCTDPETAYRVGDLLVSEYLSISTRFGKEGENWCWAKDYDRSPIDHEVFNELVNVPGAEPSIILYYPDFWGFAQQNNAWLQNGPFIRQYAIANGMINEQNLVADKKEEKLDRIGPVGNVLYQEGGWGPEEPFTPLLYTAEETAVIDDIQATLSSYIEETTAAFLMGNKDIDAEWDNYLNELKKIGIEKALEINQAAYDRAYK